MTARFLCVLIVLFTFREISIAQQTQTQSQPQSQTQSRPQSQPVTAPLVVAGPPNLRDPLTELGKFFEKSNPSFRVDVDFSSPDEIADQIHTGAPIDVFIGSSKKDLDEMESKKQILRGSISKIVSDEVVIVAAPDSTMEIKEPKDLVTADMKPVALLGGTHGFAKESKDYLTKLGLMQSLTGKTIEIKNVRDGFQKLKAGQAQWMFAYSSDASDTTKSKILWRVPQSEIPADEYYAAIPSSSRHPEAARSFLDTLHSTIAGMIFKNQGYKVPETQPQTRPAKPRQPQTQTQPHKKAHKKTPKKHKPHPKKPKP